MTTQADWLASWLADENPKTRGMAARAFTKRFLATGERAEWRTTTGTVYVCRLGPSALYPDSGSARIPWAIAKARTAPA